MNYSKSRTKAIKLMSGLIKQNPEITFYEKNYETIQHFRRSDKIAYNQLIDYIVYSQSLDFWLAVKYSGSPEVVSK